MNGEKLTGPKPDEKKQDKSQETYTNKDKNGRKNTFDDEGLKQHLNEKIDRLAEIMGVSKDSEEYKRVQEKSGDSKVVEKYRYSILDTAVIRGDAGRVKAALESGADVNRKIGGLHSPLEFAESLKTNDKYRGAKPEELDKTIETLKKYGATDTKKASDVTSTETNREISNKKDDTAYKTAQLKSSAGEKIEAGLKESSKEQDGNGSLALFKSGQKSSGLNMRTSS
ncbi:MAG: hypothetical protein PQ612_07895 [Rickettsiales bacterium]|nr:hypothetical protein [Pseudomonadota bacterium]MDA0967009.1 hypothetical protein [Pseudomonadota bacterium]MDG4543929.1 hypothetical protein [Rickettsiales bacterium]MDG4546075.1 hypothetical protein [Rickettsiales bacterium]MDG4548321.1 hypothetical protein [Rickettsiales bacterium]